MKKVQCHISKETVNREEAYQVSTIQDGLVAFMRREIPDLTEDKFISLTKLNEYRKRYLASMVTQEKGELDNLESVVLDAMHGNKILSENIEPIFNEKLTTGQKLADKIADFGGSWSFIIFFFSFILVWMAVNVFVLLNKPFDPYPFILLNLILSCLAAIQAPIIMMSQNRQEEKDRRRSEHDYMINLKAELEIKLLHEKVDHLIIHQNKRLLEIQEIQTDILNDIIKEVKVMSGNGGGKNSREEK